MTSLHVATLNIRNLADRWAERLPLLLADAAALQPDVLALQEVVYPLQQDRLIGASGEARYVTFRGWAGRPEYGNSLLVRESLGAHEGGRLDLGLNRAAHDVRLHLPGGVAVRVLATHLHHPPDSHDERLAQVEQLLAWLGDDHAATVVMGDFNADPREPAYRRMAEAGFRSAHLEANGAEPAVTWPSGIVAPGMDTDGDPDCLDYIWLRGPIRAAACRVVFDRPAVGDPTLYPSDHFGLSAQVELG